MAITPAQGHAFVGIAIGAGIGASIAASADRDSLSPSFMFPAMLLLGAVAGAGLFATSHGFRTDTGLLPPLIGALTGAGLVGSTRLALG